MNRRRQGFCVIFCLTLTVQAATLTVTPRAPTPAADDGYNFTGATHDGANYADGAANDACTYQHSRIFSLRTLNLWPFAP